ncbi:MAG TPA: V-type ATP synthase subunit D [Thermoanaerobaculia bacterium]|nr:V-type ATP synthase subunit D [Thermoanaerobaculia bacterium]
MIHPTRTDLLQLKEKVASVTNSMAILKARRQALIREFLAAVQPFLRSRETIARNYSRAIDELQLTMGHEGAPLVEALAAGSERPIGVDVGEKNVMGVHYRELTVWGPFVRSPEERNYGYAVTTPHLEESVNLFERTTEAILEVAAFENKLKMLGREIQRVTRRTRVLEERVLPRLKADIRSITQYIGEREREAHFRLKRFKNLRAARALSGSGIPASPGT